MNNPIFSTDPKIEKPLITEDGMEITSPAAIISYREPEAQVALLGEQFAKEIEQGHYSDFEKPGDLMAHVSTFIPVGDFLYMTYYANTKTTAVRVIPAYGKQAGESVSFGGLLGTAPIMDLNTYSPAKFIRRGGRIPAPIHSLKN